MRACVYVRVVLITAEILIATHQDSSDRVGACHSYVSHIGDSYSHLRTAALKETIRAGKEGGALPSDHHNYTLLHGIYACSKFLSIYEVRISIFFIKIFQDCLSI